MNIVRNAVAPRIAHTGRDGEGVATETHTGAGAVVEPTCVPAAMGGVGAYMISLGSGAQGAGPLAREVWRRAITLLSSPIEKSGGLRTTQQCGWLRGPRRHGSEMNRRISYGMLIGGANLRERQWMHGGRDRWDLGGRHSPWLGASMTWQHCGTLRTHNWYKLLRTRQRCSGSCW